VLKLSLRTASFRLVHKRLLLVPGIQFPSYPRGNWAGNKKGCDPTKVELKLKRIKVNLPIEVQPISIVYFTSRGCLCYGSKGDGVNEAATIPFAPLIPNSLLSPNASGTPLLVKYTILMGCTSVRQPSQQQSMTNAHSPQFKQEMAVAAQVQENHISLDPNFAGSYGTSTVRYHTCPNIFFVALTLTIPFFAQQILYIRNIARTVCV